MARVPTGSSPDANGDGIPEPEWGDPPAVANAGGRPRVWEQRVAPLLERPTEWAKIADFDGDLKRATDTVSNLKRRLRLPEGEFEFVSRQGAVWGRYLGPVTPPPRRRRRSTGG